MQESVFKEEKRQTSKRQKYLKIKTGGGVREYVQFEHFPVFLSVPLNSCCTVYDVTHAHADMRMLCCKSPGISGICLDLRCAVNRGGALTLSLTLVIAGAVKPQNNLSPPLLTLCSSLYGFVTFIGLQRKPAGPATTHTCSARPLGTALVFCGRNDRELRDTERAEGTVAHSHILLQALIWISIFHLMLYTVCFLLSQQSRLLRTN